MCGLFGYLGRETAADAALMKKIDGLLRHRGPDDSGFESGPNWGLGFRRLSIIDLSHNGHQPLATADGRFRLVFNGEIYNYLELRRDLEAAGTVFRGHSDSEVLLQLLAREGPERALAKTNGMFALVMVDTLEQRFLLARDRMGQKPLYFQAKSGVLRFASELKGLLAWPDAERTVNPAALTQYLHLDYLPGETCILKGYQKLPPGCFLTGSLRDPHQFTCTPYWRLDINPEDRGAPLAGAQVEELHELLKDAVRLRLRGDVPMGIFLSGGIDSGLIAMLAGLDMDPKPLALTVGFDESTHDETSLARATAQKAGLPQVCIPQPAAGLDLVDLMAWYWDEPFADPSALPSFNLCRAASSRATVFLSGDGGDEAFGGYGKYLPSLRRRLAESIPGPAAGLLFLASHLLPTLSPLRIRLARKGLPPEGLPAAPGRPPVDPIFKALLTPELAHHIPGIGEPLWRRWQTYPPGSSIARKQKLDYDLYLPDDILVKMDRASMAHSIEVRSPLLDHRLVEWAARLPRSVLLNGREGKLPLRRLAENLLPDSVRTARKQGFAVPLDPWLREPAGQSFLRERLLSPRALARGWWRPEMVGRMIEHQRLGTGRNLGRWLWRLTVLDAWARHFLDGPLPVGEPARRL